MNKFIENLKKDKKLNLVIDKSKKFNFKIGKGNINEKPIIIGPCSIENGSILQQIHKKYPNNILRGGIYKPCTFPMEEPQQIDKEIFWKEGIRDQGLDIIERFINKTKTPMVVEAMDIFQSNKLNTLFDKIEKENNYEFINAIQVGARNFQNYSFLDELGRLKNRTILLKRGPWGTIDEILGSAERIMRGGNENIIIVLRGTIGTPSYRHVFPSIRWSPDLMMIPALKKLSNIPILFDPSHSTGYSDFVIPMSKAALVAGADGLIIEIHPHPEKSLSDKDQIINFDQLDEFYNWWNLYRGRFDV